MIVTEGVQVHFTDGTMLSMPIPSVEDDILYDQLQYNGINYADILKQINPKTIVIQHAT